MRLYLMSEDVFQRLEKVGRALSVEQSMNADRLKNLSATLDWAVNSTDMWDSDLTASSYREVFNKIRELRKLPAYWEFFEDVMQQILALPKSAENDAAN